MVDNPDDFWYVLDTDSAAERDLVNLNETKRDESSLFFSVLRLVARVFFSVPMKYIFSSREVGHTKVDEEEERATTTPFCLL
jgi:hypothetical protein